MDVNQESCVLCGQNAEWRTLHTSFSAVAYKCKNCGTFTIDEDLQDIARNKFSPSELALVSHIVGRDKTKWDRKFNIDQEWIEKVTKSQRLPNPKQLLDNLIIWIGSKLVGFGDNTVLDEFGQILSEIGAQNTDALYLILMEAKNQGIINKSINITRGAKGDFRVAKAGGLELTFYGWEYYESINTGKLESKRAFMAMPFSNEELDQVFIEYWKPAIEKTGFLLERLDERPTPGSIDDRLRQTIRRSAFLVCELTDANRGAYWEAGFAEGIGIPVIYTCKKEKYNTDSHFDVNHHLCVIWENESLSSKAEELASVVQETFNVTKARNISI